MSMGSKHFYYKGDVESAHDCLFIVVYRNPIDCLHSMRKHAWHAHKSLWDRDFSSFIRAEWIGIFNEQAGVDKSNPLYGHEMRSELHPVSRKRFPNVIQPMRRENYKSAITV